MLEDFSEALGAKINNKKVGSIGDIGIFSIRSEKMIGVGEGGVIVTNNKNLYNLAENWVHEILHLEAKKILIGKNIIV